MSVERCPHCGAAVGKNAGWCTLCYADLRPAPEPAPPRPPLVSQAMAPTYPLAAPAASDALDAPYERVLAAVYGGDTALVPATEAGFTAALPTTKPAGWPCTSCGNLNPFDSTACTVCLAPF